MCSPGMARAQQSFQGLFRGEAALGVVAGDVGEQHAAGEPIRSFQGLGGGLHSEFGLADACQPCHRAYQHRALLARTTSGGGQIRQQPFDVLVTSGEGRGRGRQPGQRWGDGRRQLHGDIPALDDRVEENPAGDRVAGRAVLAGVVHAGHRAESVPVPLGVPVDGGGGGGGVVKVRLEKSRPCTTGPFWVPPLTVFVTAPSPVRARPQDGYGSPHPPRPAPQGPYSATAPGPDHPDLPQEAPVPPLRH
ncbi:hypothetical protein M2158_004561 [Streptomyces sp. SAI-144]|nr:hypothetical protein [Streptomyces sp. SAI-144]